MKNTIKVLGIIAFVALIGFLFVACDIPKDELDGTTWKGSDSTGTGTITFNSPDFTQTVTDSSGTPIPNIQGDIFYFRQHRNLHIQLPRGDIRAVIYSNAVWEQINASVWDGINKAIINRI